MLITKQEVSRLVMLICMAVLLYFQYQTIDLANDISTIIFNWVNS